MRYESVIISFVSRIGLLIFSCFTPVFKKSFFIQMLIQNTKLKLFIVYLFISSLMLPQGQGVEVTTFPEMGPERIYILGERIFNVPLFSLPILFLVPLLIIFFTLLKFRQRICIWDFEVLFLVFLVFVGVSLATTINIQASAIWFLKFMFGVLIYIIFSRLAFVRLHIWSILYLLTSLSLLNIVLSTLQFSSGGLLGIPFEEIRTVDKPEKILSFEGTGQIRAIGVLSTPNVLVAFLAILLPISIILSFKKNLLIKISAHIAIAASLLVSFLALSRWGLVTYIFAFAVTGFLLKFLNNRTREILTLVKINAVFLLLVALILFSNQVILDRFSRFSLEDGSLNTRLELITQSVYMVRENPLFGVGPGTFLVYFLSNDITQSSISKRFPAPVHNMYLLLASELGIPALFMFFLFLVWLIKFILFRIKKLSADYKLVSIGLFSALLTFLFSGLWGASPFGSRLSLFAFLIAGLLVNILTNKKVLE